MFYFISLSFYLKHSCDIVEESLSYETRIPDGVKESH